MKLARRQAEQHSRSDEIDALLVATRAAWSKIDLDGALDTILDARLVAESSRRSVEVEMLRGATVRLAGSLDVQEVAATILKETMTIAGSDTAFICVTAGDGRPLELARYVGISREDLRAVLSAPG